MNNHFVHFCELENNQIFGGGTDGGTHGGSTECYEFHPRHVADGDEFMTVNENCYCYEGFAEEAIDEGLHLIAEAVTSSQFSEIPTICKTSFL